MIADFEV